MMFDDPNPDGTENEVVYMCKAPAEQSTHAGEEIGIVAITCPGWEKANKGPTDEERAKLDALIAAREARTKSKPERE